MARGGKKLVEAEANPEAEERSRLKKIAFSKGMLSEKPAKGLTALTPSKIVAKHHGCDILRKSQRKNRFLFSFPGLIAPISGGKIGELKDLGTKNPILYLDYPQGQMKLFGTIVYPENKYLTLQFSRGGKNVMCEDYFDTMIVFSEAWWIGTKDENPEEARLEYPKELHVAQQESYNFTGGAGATSKMKPGTNKSALKYEEPESPKTDPEDDSMECQNDLEPVPQITPTRHSERTAGKRYKFKEEHSSGDDIVDDDASSEEDQKESDEDLPKEQSLTKSKSSRRVVFDIDNEEAVECTEVLGHVQKSGSVMAKSIKPSHEGHTPLVQTTISTLFKKVEVKKATDTAMDSTSSKAPSQKSKRSASQKKTTKPKDEGPQRKRKASRTENLVEDDDIEEFSSPSKETSESDEDWAG